MEHVFEKHVQCEKQYCPICEGGLSVCTVCGGLEGALTTECCGYEINTQRIDEVYVGAIDFKDGKWVEETSKHSPAYKHTTTKPTST